MWIVLIVLIAVIYGLACFCYYQTFFVSPRSNRDPHVLLSGKQYYERRNEILQLVESALKIPYKDVFTTSFDCYRLHAAYYEAKKGAPVEIMFHGYRSIALRDFCGAVQSSLNRGHNVLLVDQRAHGKSEGQCLTFGINERKDCLSWINFVNENYGKTTPIILVGVSMGAATVLSAASLDLPQNVVGIIADSPYSSAKEIIKKVIRDRHLPPTLLYPFVKMGAKVCGRFSLEESSPLSSVLKAKIPVLIFHGEADYFVPVEMSRELFCRCSSDKKLYTFSGAGHGLSSLVDKERYQSALDEFYQKVL